MLAPSRHKSEKGTLVMTPRTTTTFTGTTGI